MRRFQRYFLTLIVSLGLALDPFSGASQALAQGRARSGPAPISAAQFRLHNDNQWGESSAINSMLNKHCKRVGLKGVLGDLTRKARTLGGNILPGTSIKFGFRWDSADEQDRRWFPQGVTGSGDGNGSGLVENRRLIAVSWHFNEILAFGAADQGARVSFVDITEAKKPRYRHVLLVESFKDKRGANFKAQKIHAGGLAWYGDFLYVADAKVGLRVFDLTNIMKVNRGKAREIGRGPGAVYHAHNYSYILPQVNCYRLHPKSAKLRFSSLSLDRSTKTPSLITGEYKLLSRRGKILRWQLDKKSFQLKGTTDITPSEAYEMGQSRVQGVLSFKGQFWMASSGLRPSLRTAKPLGKIHSMPWVIGPEDLYLEAGSSLLWTATEFPSRRYLFGLALPGLQKSNAEKKHK